MQLLCESVMVEGVFYSRSQVEETKKQNNRVCEAGTRRQGFVWGAHDPDCDQRLQRGRGE
jgi:hypothetical protein